MENNPVIKIRHYVGVEPGTYPDDISVYIGGQEFLRVHGVATDTASGERGPVTDLRWFDQPSGGPVTDEVQRLLDALINVEYVEVHE